jgi:hypothetical protein
MSLDAPQLAMGICILTIGAALMLDRLGIVPAAQILRLWPVGIILIGAAMVAQSLWPPPEGYTPRRHRGGFVPFLFFSIMLSFALFASQRADRRTVGASPDSTVSLFAIAGRDRQVSVTSRFQGGEMMRVMGGTDLDLRQATMAPGEEAVIEVFAVMGGAVLRVPGDWVVDVQTVPIMGGVQRQPPTDPASAPADGAARPRLIVRGLVVMGGLTIRSYD